MNKLLRAGILTAFAGATAFGGMAQADEATTSGGFKIKTDDGKFDAAIGGRIHFDALVNIPAKHPFGAAKTSSDTNSDFEFRRAFLTVGGHLYGFEYKFEEDFAGSSFQDVYIAHPLFGGTIYAGQRKPWRSLDEIASNNNTPFLERNYASASNGGSGGIYGGLDYNEGLFYSRNQTIGLLTGDSLWTGASVYSLHKQASSAQVRTQGTGYNVRVAYAPFTDKTRWAHIGVSYSNDNVDVGAGSVNNALAPTFFYAGRIGPSFKAASYSSFVPKGSTVDCSGATVPATAADASCHGPHVDVIHGELAGVYGPLYAQAEYVDAAYHQQGSNANSVDVYSVTTAYTLTGESRAYDAKNATYGAIKPKGPNGALELAVRYDHARNNNVAGFFQGATKGGGTEISVSTVTVGLNYYVNPAVRFVLDYTHGRAAIGTTQDNPSAVGLRAQLVF